MYCHAHKELLANGRSVFDPRSSKIEAAKTGTGRSWSPYKGMAHEWKAIWDPQDQVLYKSQYVLIAKETSLLGV